MVTLLLAIGGLLGAERIQHLDEKKVSDGGMPVFPSNQTRVARQVLSKDVAKLLRYGMFVCVLAFWGMFCGRLTGEKFYSTNGKYASSALWFFIGVGFAVPMGILAEYKDSEVSKIDFGCTGVIGFALLFLLFNSAIALSISAIIYVFDLRVPIRNDMYRELGGAYGILLSCLIWYIRRAW